MPRDMTLEDFISTNFAPIFWLFVPAVIGILLGVR